MAWLNKLPILDVKPRNDSECRCHTFRDQAVVFAVFLTDNQAFINSVYDDPPTYSSGKYKCRIVDAEMYKKDDKEYESACVELLQSGYFRRVHVYVDAERNCPDSMLTEQERYRAKLKHKIIDICHNLDIHVDVTNTPCMENRMSPRTRRIEQYEKAFQQHIDSLDATCARQSRKQLIERVSHVCEKMNAILQGKLLNTNQAPEDADTVFAFHQCWKELYDIITEETQRPGKTDTAAVLSPEELRTQRLYSLDITRYYYNIKL